MVVDPIHVMDAKETTSEAVKNYAGAAFLLGMAVFAVGMGAGMLTQSIRNLRKSGDSSSIPDDLVDAIRSQARKGKPQSAKPSTAEELVETLKSAMGALNPGDVVIDQKSGPECFYSVNKNFKGKVEVGGNIPENFLTKKPDSMDMDTFLKREQVKFKSHTVISIKGSPTLVTVEEIVNSEPVKTV